MADLRFENKNNQKKEISVSATGVLSTSATMNDTLFTLPAASLVTAVYAIVTTASGVATSNVKVLVGTTNVATGLVVGTTGVKTGTFAGGYFATGGSVTVQKDTVAPDAAGRIKIVVEYIETELTEGTYTD